MHVYYNVMEYILNAVHFDWLQCTTNMLFDIEWCHMLLNYFCVLQHVSGIHSMII